MFISFYFSNIFLKKASIILIITALILCNAGFYFSYLAGRIKIHAQVEAMMNKLQPNQLIAIADSSIKQNDWDEKDKEFSYKSEMYDVVKIDTINGQKVFYCLNDTKETTLENTFAEQIEKQQNSGKKATSVFFLKIVYMSIEPITLFEAQVFLTKTTYPPVLVTKIITRPQDILHPPPTMALTYLFI